MKDFLHERILESYNVFWACTYTSTLLHLSLVHLIQWIAVISKFHFYCRVNSKDRKNNNIQPFKMPFNFSSFYFDHRLTQQLHWLQISEGKMPWPLKGIKVQYAGQEVSIYAWVGVMHHFIFLKQDYAQCIYRKHCSDTALRMMLHHIFFTLPS